MLVHLQRGWSEDRLETCHALAAFQLRCIDGTTPGPCLSLLKRQAQGTGVSILTYSFVVSWETGLDVWTPAPPAPRYPPSTATLLFLIQGTSVCL